MTQSKNEGSLTFIQYKYFKDFFHTQIISKFDVKVQILVNRFEFINKNKNVMVNIPYPI